MLQNNVFNTNIYKHYEDNSKYIDIGRRMDISKDEDIYSDPFNPKWYIDNNDDEKIYDKRDIELLNKRIQNYCQNNKGRKNYLEYCDNNSQTLNTIRELNNSLNILN